MERLGKTFHTDFWAHRHTRVRAHTGTCTRAHTGTHRPTHARTHRHMHARAHTGTHTHAHTHRHTRIFWKASFPLSLSPCRCGKSPFGHLGWLPTSLRLLSCAAREIIISHLVFYWKTVKKPFCETQKENQASSTTVWRTGKPLLTLSSSCWIKFPT